MKNNPSEYLLNVEYVLTLDTLMNARYVKNFLSQKHGFKWIVHVLYEIIGFESKNYTSTTFSHDSQNKFVEDSFSILSKLPPRSQPLTNCTVVLASVVTEVMCQHKEETKIQDAALHVLDKYIIALSELHSRFRKDAGLLLTQNALKLPDLSSESHKIAQKILRVCARH